MKQKGHGFFRKSKAYGLVCGIALAGVFMISNGVSADEVTQSGNQPKTETVGKLHAVEVKNTDGSLAGITLVREGQVETTETKSEIATSVPANSSQDQAVEAVDKAQNTLKSNVDKAKEAGVVVNEGNKEKVVIDDSNAAEKANKVLSDLNKQDQVVKEATEKQIANQKAYDDTTKDREEAIKKGQDNLSSSATEVDKLVKEAKQAGLIVDEKSTDTKPEYKDLKGLEGEKLRKAMSENLELYKQAVKAGVELQGKSVEDLKRAIALYKSNQKAYNETTKDLENATKSGLSALSEANKKQDEVVAAASKASVKATTKTEVKNVSYVTVAKLTGQELRKAIASNIDLYNKAVKDAVVDTNRSTTEMKMKLDDYNKQMAEYNQKLAKWNSGELNSLSAIKWASGTTVEASTGTTRLTGNERWNQGTSTEWASFAIQGDPVTQNTDANFNNMFRLTNGGGSVIIKNTSNGDVKLTISNFKTAIAGSDDYLVVWGSNGGGIAWGLFSMFSGSGATGTGGEHAAIGSGAISGYILTFPRSYDWKVETTGKVASFTFNDIDNNQYITVDGNNAQSGINVGSAITQAGNKFSSRGGDVSQGSAGKVDTNGIQYLFDELKTLSVSGTHVTNEPIDTSIVGGIFGVSSEVKPPKPTTPNPITLEGIRYSVDLPGAPEAPQPERVVANKVTVEVPDAPEAPKPQEVDVHYYEIEKTPAPTPTPKNVLPHTGEQQSVLAVVGTAMLSGLVLFGFSKKKQEN